MTCFYSNFLKNVKPYNESEAIRQHIFLLLNTRCKWIEETVNLPVHSLTYGLNYLEQIFKTPKDIHAFANHITQTIQKFEPRLIIIENEVYLESNNKSLEITLFSTPVKHQDNALVLKLLLDLGNHSWQVTRQK